SMARWRYTSCERWSLPKGRTCYDPAPWNSFQSILAPQIEQYLRAKRAMGCKFACEDRQLRLLDRFLNNRGVESIEAIDAQCLQDFLDSRKRTNPRSYNNPLGDVRRLFDWIASQHIPGA